MKTQVTYRVNYSELDELLRQTRSATCAADCHGFLCAQVCVTENSERDVWEDYLDLQSEDELLVRECCEEIDALISEIRRLLFSPDFDFQLLLPDDDTPLHDRVNALGEWCHGFLNGFALGQNTAPVLEQEDSKELIENFTRICNIGADEVAGDTDEQALFELVEYVRMGAMYIFDRMQPYNSSNDTPEFYH
jgi:uncharacterized protein YgfB (UPF0149 family)